MRPVLALLLATAVWSRPRQFDVNLLASFPAGDDIPSIVIGQPANTTAKTSTSWVLILAHEHIPGHGLARSDPGFLQGYIAVFRDVIRQVKKAKARGPTLEQTRDGIQGQAACASMRHSWKPDTETRGTLRNRRHRATRRTSAARPG